MKLTVDELDARHAKILETCEPYIVTYPSNLGALDLAPFGWQITDEHCYDPTRMRSRVVIDGLHHLDAFSFGDQDMLMPRWVLFDCGEFPGIVFGFGRKAKDLAIDTRKAYRVEGPEHGETFLPLSMWVAIRCAEEGAWFGHNLSSANLVSAIEPLPGLATITKAFGVRVAKCATQYGATQWDSSSIGIHMSLGQMQVLCAHTPAHTHPETLAYRIDTDADVLSAPLRPDFKKAAEGGDRHVDGDDIPAIHALHEDIEQGASYALHRIEKREGLAQRVWLKQV